MSERPCYIEITVDDAGIIWWNNNVDMAIEIPSQDIPRIIKELQEALYQSRAVEGNYKAGDIVYVNGRMGQIQSIFTPTELEPQYNVYLYGLGTRTVLENELTPDNGGNDD